jgi:sodium/proline symporter
VASQKGLSLSIIPDHSFESILTLISLSCWGLGYLGQPHIVTKFMGIKNPDEIYKSKYLGMGWLVISLGAASVIGLCSIPLFPNLENPELLFIEIVKKYFSSGIGGVILCAIIAATVSTMASQILVAASSLSEDFYKRLSKTKTSSKNDLIVSRASVLVIALVSLLFAFNKSQTIMGVVEYAWSGLGCSFGPLMLASLYSRQVNREGAIAGIITGGVVAAFWPLLNPYLLSVEVISMLPGFVLSLTAIYLVSFFTAKEAVFDSH